MASLSSDENGNRTVQFVAGDGKRRSVRLGKVPKKVAEGVKLRVEALNAAAVSRLPLDGETATWVAGIGDDLAAKLAAVGLIPARASQTLGAFLADRLAACRAEFKPATAVNLSTVANDLTRYFGESSPLRDITPAAADAFRTHYLTREPKLSPDTAARRLRTVRKLFKDAAALKLVDANPFSGVRARATGGADRKVYVPAADVERIIAVSSPAWRIMLALARHAGLRCPSEVLSLRWADVNWEAGRMTVPSCKTEHLPGKAYRVCPIFAALRPHLEEAFELAGPGAEYVVPGGYRAAALGPAGWKALNLRTQLLKLVRRAGLQPWPKLWQNLRASCETDLMQHHPIHAVTSWIGNTPSVALKHYLQVLDIDFEKAAGGGAESGAAAVRNPVQSATVPGRHATTPGPQTLTGVGDEPSVTVPVGYCRPIQVGREGVEPTSNPL